MNLKTSVLVALTDKALAERLAYDLERSGFSSDFAATEHDTIENLRARFFDVVVADSSLPKNSGVDIIHKVKSSSPNTEVIIVGEPDSPDLAARAISGNALAYVVKPLLGVGYLSVLIPKVLEQKQLKIQFEKRSNQLTSFLSMTDDIVSGLDTKRLLKQIVKRALVLTGSEYGSVSLLENGKTVMQESWDGKEWQESQERKSPGRGSNAKNEQRDKSALIPCLRSYTSVPIVDRTGDFLGFIEAGNNNGEREFSRDDIQLLEGLARTAAIGIENLRLHEGTKTIKDITDRKKTDEEILRLAAAVRSLNPAVTITDMNRNIIYINPAHKKVFGYSLEELIGKQGSILYPFDDPHGVSKKIYEAVLMVGWEGERVGVRKNGEVFPVYEKTSVVKDKQGQQIGIVSVVEDITARKRLEQAVKESEERYRTLVETAKSAIIAINEDGKITLFNPAAEELFGYSKGEVDGKEIVFLLPEKYRDVHRAEIKGYVETGASSFLGKTVELAGVKKDGEEFPIEVSLSTCRIGGRRIFTAIIFDITERKTLQEQLIQSEKMAAVGQLISGVTHEINNPLAAVMGYTEMFLEEPRLDGQLRKGLQVIYDESNKAKKVIQNLLSFARKRGPDRELIYINEVIERTLNLKEYDFRKNNIEVIKNLDSDLPLTLVDPNQLQQVFLNLIINAEQALTSTGKDDRQISIQSKLKNGLGRVSSQGDSAIEVTFSDNGPGIPKKNIKKIFDPFFTTKAVGKGTGLGLSVSYGIIKEHGGQIYALSEEGKGATFIIELPVVSPTGSPKS